MITVREEFNVACPPPRIENHVIFFLFPFQSLFFTSQPRCWYTAACVCLCLCMRWLALSFSVTLPFCCLPLFCSCFFWIPELTPCVAIRSLHFAIVLVCMNTECLIVFGLCWNVFSFLSLSFFFCLFTFECVCLLFRTDIAKIAAYLLMFNPNDF